MRIRPERVAQAMRREIADILVNELRDPRIDAFVSITDVIVTKDLSFAKVYVSMLKDGVEREHAMEALQHAVPFIRRLLAPRMGLREMPDMRFMLDTSMERGARVDELLRKIKDGEPIPEDDQQG